MKRPMTVRIIVVAALFFTSAAVRAQVADIPLSIPYQGHLTNADGSDFDGTVHIEARLYDSLIAGLGQGVANSHVVYAETHSAIPVDGGNFRIALGEGASLTDALADDDFAGTENVYLELWINGERLSPRQRMGAIPAVARAQRANYADSLSTTISPDDFDMPSYDAAKITEGIFQPSQIPHGLDASLFHRADRPADQLRPGAVPNVDAAHFAVGSIYPTLDPAVVPAGLNPAIITGDPLSLDRMPAAMLTSDEVYLRSGTIGDSEVLLHPLGYTDSQCSVMLTLAHTAESIGDSIRLVEVSRDTSGLVTCRYSNDVNGSNPKSCTAAYVHLCAK